MTLWETQTAEEAARNAQWEEINDTEPEEEVNLDSIMDHIDNALDDLAEAKGYIQSAADNIAGDPIADRILSVLPDLERIDGFVLGLRALIDDLRKEE